MKEEGYKIRDQEGIYFITFATVQWVDARLTGRAGIQQELLC